MDTNQTIEIAPPPQKRSTLGDSVFHLPIKEVISLDQLKLRYKEQQNKGNAKEASAPATKPEQKNEAQRTGEKKGLSPNLQFKHPEKEFFAFCSCKFCMSYRDVILQILEIKQKTEIVWAILRQTMQNTYEPLFKMDRKYALNKFKAALNKNSIYWLISGIMSINTYEQLEFIESLPILDKFGFVALVGLLTEYDAQQMFELFSYSLQSCLQAFYDGLEAKMSSEKPEDLLFLLVRGYDELCKIAENMSSLLHKFEQKHLRRKLSLSWIQWNKIMFHQHVYSQFVAQVPENNYKNLLTKKYTRFYNEINEIGKLYRQVWTSLHKYICSDEERSRRQRIKTIYKQFEIIRKERYIQQDTIMETSEWRAHKDRHLVWNSMMAHIKLFWPQVNLSRVNQGICDLRCDRCQALVDFHGGACACATCAFIVYDGPEIPEGDECEILCTMCIESGKLAEIMENVEMEMVESTNDAEAEAEAEPEIVCMDGTVAQCYFDSDYEEGEYHFSWAVFQHLDRKQYIHETIEEKYFCKECKEDACLLARKIVANGIDLNLSLYLVGQYHPVVLPDDEILDMLPNVMLCIRKTLSRLYTQFYFDVEKTYYGFMISALVKYFIDVNEPIPIDYDMFEILENDIFLKVKLVKGDNSNKIFVEFLDKLKSILKYDDVLSTASSSDFESDSSPERTQKSVQFSIGNQSKHKTDAGGQSNSIQKTTYEDPPVGLDPNAKKPSKDCSGKGADPKEKFKENHTSGKKRVKKECGHARVNETRDRLRKKLSQIANAKKTAKATASKVAAQMSKNYDTLSKKMSEMDIKANPKADCACKEAPKKTPEPPKCCSKPHALPKVTAEKRIVPKTASTIKPATSTTVSVTPAPTTATPTVEEKNEKNVTKWIKDTLSFIEGSDSKGPVNDKKAAKRAKQKQKKEESKRIEELQDLRSQFHDIYFKEFAAKNDLKELKMSKKKEKKKVSELEASIKKFGKAKANMESRILELIATIKVTNSEFKFAYLPTKEQQLERLQKKTPATNNNNVSEFPTPPNPFGDIDKPESGGDSPILTYPNIVPTEPVAMENFSSSPNIQMSYAQQQPGDSTDPAKRIVTIRRVNLPHVPEPQVTVTAKGTSPNEDKLLYTFINGHLVQTNPGAKQPTIVVSKTEKKTNASASAAASAASCPKTKTQLKKERRRAKKLEEEKEAAEEEQRRLAAERAAEEKERQKAKKDNSKKKKSKGDDEKKPQNKQEPTVSLPEDKSKGKKSKQATVTPIVPQTEKSKGKGTNPAQAAKSKTKGVHETGGKSKKKTKTAAPARDSSKSESERSIDSVKPKTPNHQSDPRTETGARPKEIVEKKKRQKVIDNGQFDNNQFKMLHLSDFTDSDVEQENVESAESSFEKKQPPVIKISESSSDKPITATAATQKSVSKTTQTEVKANKKSNNPKQMKSQASQVEVQVSNKKTLNEKTKPPVTQSQQQQRQQKLTVNNQSSQTTVGAGKPNRNQNKSKTNSNTAKLPAHQNYQQQNQKLPKSASLMKSDQNANNIHHSIQKLSINASASAGYHQSNHHPATSSSTFEFYSQNDSFGKNFAHSANVSIMDQLNRGVLVEHLTLPPGITLTKVDPSKAEALRAKQESIERISKPLTQQPKSQHNLPSQTFYPHVLGGFRAPDQSGIIMVDAMKSKSKSASISSASVDGQDQKRRRRRRYKKKSDDVYQSQPPSTSNAKANTSSSKQPPKMVTLRNPMFHGTGPTLTNPVVHPPATMPIAPLPVDQPAAIIKNENGMFTIRNPALHQAVANGYQPGNYRQFASNYYTQPEIANPSTESFSYFSNNVSVPAPIPASSGIYPTFNDNDNRPEKSKCISAIGSEVKNAQQQKKQSKENQWPNNASEQNRTSTQSNVSCGYLGGLSSSLQQKYQNTNYYNGFDAFPQSNASACGSLFDNTHTHHNCGGEDSPPPTVTGFNHYLDGIPNTGVIRYDDASFLKTLMPGQNLNNEVSIHNINEANFPRSSSSPVNRVEITPIYGSRTAAKHNPFETPQLRTNQFAENLTEFGDNVFTPNKMLNLNDLESGDRDVESFKRFSYDFEPPREKQKVNINMNDLMMKNNKSDTSSRSSPFFDDLDSFVQNLNTLKIGCNEEANCSVNGSSHNGNSPNGWW